MPRTFFLALTEVWFWQLLSGVLFILCLGLIIYRPWRYSGKKYLKRLSKLEKSQLKMMASGMNWDKRLSEAQLKTAERLALLDLRELAKQIRENMDLISKDAIKDERKYKKALMKVIGLKKKFINAVYVVGLSGLEVPTDPFNPIYDEVREELKGPKTKKLEVKKQEDSKKSVSKT
ncbi:MAG: hypothetical protein DRH33_00855 [Candidatus Nealsonbacteria bacterium]|nr:MAG: hypothetical protein DRH33_00855 [Candidatus Nealsonbacteria bacterium]